MRYVKRVCCVLVISTWSGGDFSVSQYDECLWEVLKSGWFVKASFRMNEYMCSEQNNNTWLKIGSIINLIQQDLKWQRLCINLIYLWSIIKHQTLPFIAQRHNLSPLTNSLIHITLSYFNLIVQISNLLVVVADVFFCVCVFLLDIMWLGSALMVCVWLMLNCINHNWHCPADTISSFLIMIYCIRTFTGFTHML